MPARSKETDFYQPRIKRSHANSGLLVVGTAVAVVGALALSGNLGGGRPAASSEGGSPTPTAITATPTPEGAGAATPTPDTSANYSPAGHYQMGEFAKVKAGDFVVGDIKVAPAGTGETANDLSKFARLYDTDGHTAPGVTDTAQTGLITHFQQDAEIYLPYGGDDVRGVTNPDVWVTGQIQDMINGGCENGCSQGVGVKDSQGNWKPVEWTGMDTTMTQEGILAKDVLAEDNNSTATASPEASHPADCQCVVCCNICPTASATPSMKCPEDDHQMGLGDVFTLPAGDKAIVEADAVIDPKLDKDGKPVKGTGTIAHDSLGSTGALDKLYDGKSHVIWTPVGAGDVQVFCPTVTQDTLQKWYDADLNALINTGRTLDSKSVDLE